MELRYLGFDQLQNSRAFRFDVSRKGEATLQAVVTADMGLFLKHHVAIQEGPSLCACRLSKDLEADTTASEHVLSGDDLQEYAQARAAHEEKRAEARRGVGRRHSSSAFVNPGSPILR